eukprot:6045184-Pyramimonas_sp.AAC.1
MHPLWRSRGSGPPPPQDAARLQGRPVSAAARLQGRPRCPPRRRPLAAGGLRYQPRWGYGGAARSPHCSASPRATRGLAPRLRTSGAVRARASGAVRAR